MFTKSRILEPITEMASNKSTQPGIHRSIMELYNTLSIFGCRMIDKIFSLTEVDAIVQLMILGSEDIAKSGFVV